jgi:hypothetical protein
LYGEQAVLATTKLTGRDLRISMDAIVDAVRIL